MNDALWMYHYFDVLHLDSEQPVRLDHLQPFVKQRRRIDSDFWTHIPSRVFQRLLCRKIDKFVRRRFAKRSAGRRQNDSASFRALLFAASPTISIRSGMSRATFSALLPIDPVAPRITTRLRFIRQHNQRSSPLWTATAPNCE